MPRPLEQTAEQQRLQEANQKGIRWRLWGPYLSERQWGTVREDYSPNGAAWQYLPHDHARSRAYRWGEDGLAGLADHLCRICFSVALWNGRDPILKERLFGLSGPEGNHGEDVKEIYYYLDATPTHSYLKMLYKYPQRAFPYDDLVKTNARRGKLDPEYELLDTGVFDDDRYFDVFVEYAKGAVDDVLIQIRACNRSPDPAPLHVLPQIWFRNTWSWNPSTVRPSLRAEGDAAIALSHYRLGRYTLHADIPPTPAPSTALLDSLFTDNDTDTQRIFGRPAPPGFFKDAFHKRIIEKNAAVVNPAKTGTKGAFHWQLLVPAHGEATIRLRLTGHDEGPPFADFDRVFSQRRNEADEYFNALQADIHDADARLIQRQALAGMIWSKQYYGLDVHDWLRGDPGQPPPPIERTWGRNADWGHLHNSDIISMPDAWEYPWYAAWDLAFHCIPLALVDAEFAKAQLVLMTREWYMHPNGQLPAYEWAFGDVNPPVHAWAAWRVFQIDRKQHGGPGDISFLERVFHKLMINFTWWVNRKDTHGRNIFQGGFLGLDNIGVFDRSAELPTGGQINQADGTSWMAMYSLNLMRIALELALHNPVYEDIASKFFEHFLGIAAAMTNLGGTDIGLWDDEDEFYYDELRLPDGRIRQLKVRSMVGLIPLFAVETLEPELLARLPGFTRRLEWVFRHRPELAALVSRWRDPGRGERRLLSLLRGHRMKCLLRRMLDESEFLSDYGVRALSKEHERNPYTFACDGQQLTVSYRPAESDSTMFGGNSNWRGPIWFPVNFLIIESLQKFHHYYGDDFLIECPTGSKRLMTINDVANELAARLSRLFRRDEKGRRAVFGDSQKLQTDPHFRDYVPFYEYFHGDNGRGVGASHQTGWTGLIAKLLIPRRQGTQTLVDLPIFPRS